MKMKRQNKWIKKGDKVYVIAGNDRGMIGEVLSRTDDRVIVQGVNVRKKHVKRSQENQSGGVIRIERPIDISNVRLCVDEETSYKVRVRRDDQGNRLVYHKNGEEVVYRSFKSRS